MGNPRLWDMLRSAVTSVFTDKKAVFAFAGETEEELLALKEMIEDGTGADTNARPHGDRLEVLGSCLFAPTIA